jgi:twitching motility protein PilT
MLSIRDLLLRFADDEHRFGKIWRLSDLHLKVGEPASYRRDDELEALDQGAPLTPAIVERLLYPLLTRAQIESLTAEPPRDVDAGFEMTEEGLNFRINAFHDRQGLACAIRVLPTTVPEPEDIGFPTTNTWKEIVELRQGLVLVTGITGSGKSTTVASLLQNINHTCGRRIITLEDPIEYAIQSARSLVSQREVGNHVTSFHDGLRSALREDPDVLFVGEMRDRETSALALSAAETGHLVLSTLHTKDARGAVTRIVDLFPSDRGKEIASQISFSLTFVLAQKLVPRSDGHGRRVAMEVLKNIPPIANHIRTGKWHQIYSTMEAHRRAGVMTLERHLTQLARNGEISLEVARRFANEPALVG